VSFWVIRYPTLFGDCERQEKSLVLVESKRFLLALTSIWLGPQGGFLGMRDMCEVGTKHKVQLLKMVLVKVLTKCRILFS
jgi:hypothetical protein